MHIEHFYARFSRDETEVNIKGSAQCSRTIASQVNNQCIINHIISTQITEYFSHFFLETVNICWFAALNWPCGAMQIYKFACVIQESFFFLLWSFVVALLSGRAHCAFMTASVELPHSLISLNFFGYMSIFRHIFLSFLSVPCATIHTTLLTAYVNEEI